MTDCFRKDKTPMLDISEFYVIAVVSNPIRYKRRWHLFKEFQDHMRDMGAQVLVVEQAFGRRQPQIAEDYKHEDKITSGDDYTVDLNGDGIPDNLQVKCNHNPFHLVVRTNQELWYKENLINLRNF